MATRRVRKILENLADGTPASQIVRMLSQHGGMTAAQVARATGLARSTVSMAINALRQQQVVVETEDNAMQQNRSGAGRPGTIVTLNPKAGAIVGVHMGWDEVRIVVADISHTFIAERQIHLGVDFGPAEALASLRQAFDEFCDSGLLKKINLLGIGVSVSGPVSPGGVLQRGGILPRWAGLNIQHLFSKTFDCPVLVDNESNCAAVAELKWGAARGARDFVLFKMDVGVGGAVVSNGILVTGFNGGAGEFGHVSINPEGELCRCGNRGCLELYASFQKPLEQLSRVHRKSLTMEDAIALAESGDAGALRMIADVGDYGGRGMAMVGNILNPPLFVIGGRMALAGDLLLAPMRAAYSRHTLIKPQDGAMPVIQVGKFTENDSLLGAVGLVLNNYKMLVPS